MDAERYGPPHDKLARAILKLPKYERLVITLGYFDDLGETDVARILELDVATVQTLKERGIRRLRDALK